MVSERVTNPRSTIRSSPSVWAIVPVKSLYESKRRLAHILSVEERATLIHQFFVQTLSVLNRTPGVDRVLVVSRDGRILATARSSGAQVLVETAVTGLNTAVTQAVNYAAQEGATAVLILPADLPFIQTEDVAIMVGRKLDSPHIIICADDKGSGTNALLVSPPGDFSFHYGVDSFQQHLYEAARRKRAARIIRAPGLMFDLDTEEDWRKYQLTIHHSPFTIHH